MIEGLENVLAGDRQPGLIELRGSLQELLGGAGGVCRFLGQQALQPGKMRVVRLRFLINGQSHSVVIKRLKPEIARRNELVAQRWLPAVGLGESGPPILASSAARGGECVWHVYEDLGDFELDPRQPSPGSVASAVELIAQLHTRFAGHALLGEVRLNGGDSGMHFYESNVYDALCALEKWQPAGEHSGLRDRLLKRLGQLRGELGARAEAQAAWGGPDTLLHGDLWAINVFVIPGLDGLRARLIDWDHAAVGPVSYDLSTFLLRFPAGQRSWIFELYRDAVAGAGWRLPDERKLNYLFETHEYARLANLIIWPAIALVTERAEWGVAALTEIEQWFEQYEPVLPVTEAVAA
jgi:hypothetical protein